MEENLNIIARGDILVESLVTHRVALAEAPQACEVLIQDPNVDRGVVILPQET